MPNLVALIVCTDTCWLRIRETMDANVAVISPEASVEFLVVKKRLAFQRTVVIVVSGTAPLIYALIAARVIPFEYSVIGALFLLDGVSAFFFTATNLIFSAGGRSQASVGGSADKVGFLTAPHSSLRISSHLRGASNAPVESKESKHGSQKVVLPLPDSPDT
jgi:hypothetical protein